jgi:RimJ/RimL family protein N-acetyltransferase
MCYSPTSIQTPSRSSITATILPDNYDMQRVARKAGFTVRLIACDADLAAALSSPRLSPVLLSAA